MSTEATPTLRRITVGEVRKAMAGIGYSLKQRMTLNVSDRCGCPIGLLAAGAGHPSNSLAIASFELGLHPDYVQAFVIAFDNHPDPYPDAYWDNQTQLAAAADGFAVAEALLPREGVAS